MTGPELSAGRAGLGERLRRFRMARGMTQLRLAQRARLSQPRISQIESGRDPGPFTPRTLRDLADGIGVGLADLIADDPLYEDLAAEQAELGLTRQPVPVDATDRLIGREQDLERIAGLLHGRVRLLTLLGPGGVGKTQLALRVIADHLGAFAEGADFVSLAGCRDMAGVVAAVAQAVALREREDLPLRDRLVLELRDSHLLLVLDNAEHVVTVVAELAALLLASCPRLTLVVTSRLPLRLKDEQRHEVRPLGLPDPRDDRSAAVVAEAPAVELFLRKARLASPSFVLTDANAGAVADICARLGGVPLAVELAAPRLRFLSPNQLLRQLDRRLAVLTNGARDLPHRQRSLRASIAWSLELLGPEDRALLRRLAVFSGGFRLEAAAEVAASGPEPDGGVGGSPPMEASDRTDVAGALGTFLDHNLLTRGEGWDGTPRFGMLEDIREFAQEELDEAGETESYRLLHLGWCLALAERAAEHMFTFEEAGWVHRLREEDANVQAALAWSLDPGRPPALETGRRLAGALCDFWYVSGQLGVGRAWFARAAQPGSESEPSIGLARSLVGAAVIEQVQAAVEPATDHAERGLAMARALSDTRTVARALLTLGNLALMQGHFERAESLHLAAHERFVRCEEQPWTAITLIALGFARAGRGKLDAAHRCADAALAIARAIGDLWDTVAATALAAEVSLQRGALDRAAALFAECLAVGWRQRRDRDVADALAGIATVAVESGDLDRAARLLGAAEGLYRRLGIGIPPPLRRDWFESVARIQAGLGSGRFARAWGSVALEFAVAEGLGAARPDGRRTRRRGPRSARPRTRTNARGDRASEHPQRRRDGPGAAGAHGARGFRRCVLSRLRVGRIGLVSSHPAAALAPRAWPDGPVSGVGELGKRVAQAFLRWAAQRGGSPSRCCCWVARLSANAAVRGRSLVGRRRSHGDTAPSGRPRTLVRRSGRVRTDRGRLARPVRLVARRHPRGRRRWPLHCREPGGGSPPRIPTRSVAGGGRWRRDRGAAGEGRRRCSRRRAHPCYRRRAHPGGTRRPGRDPHAGAGRRDRTTPRLLPPPARPPARGDTRISGRRGRSPCHPGTPSGDAVRPAPAARRFPGDDVRQPPDRVAPGVPAASLPR